jgi:hypothetical protein
VLFSTLEDMDTKLLIKGLIILTFNQNKQIKLLQERAMRNPLRTTTSLNSQKDMKIKALEDEIKRLKISTPGKQVNMSKVVRPPVTGNMYSKVVSKPIQTSKHVRSSSVTIESKADRTTIKK